MIKQPQCSSLIPHACSSVGREGIEPTLLIESDCFTDSLDSQVQSTHWFSSDAGGIRTRNREGLSFAAVPVRVPRRHEWCGWDSNPQTLRFELSRYANSRTAPCCRVARQGIEPCLTVSKTVVRIHHTRKPCCFHQCPCQESNLIFDLRRVACASTTLHRHIHSGAGGIRTHKHLLLKQAAQPLAYHTI